MTLSILSGDPLEMGPLVSSIYPVPPDQTVADGEILTFEVREADGEGLGLVQGIRQIYAVDGQMFEGELSYDVRPPSHEGLQRLGDEEVYACALTVRIEDGSSRVLHTSTTLPEPAAQPRRRVIKQSPPYRPAPYEWSSQRRR